MCHGESLCWPATGHCSASSTTMKLQAANRFILLPGLTIPGQVLFKVFRKSFHRRLNGPRRRITQRTERLAFNVVAEIEQQPRVFGSSATAVDAFENLY